VQETNKIQEIVKAVIFKKDKFLLQLRDNRPDIPYPNTWAFFGGGVEDSENHKEALKRELEEELGWSPESFEYLIKIMNKTYNCEITHYILECSVSPDKLCLGEGAAMGWFTYDEVLKLENKLHEVEYVTSLANNYIINS
jgi:8-oxo-dGTP diphosphatase